MNKTVVVNELTFNYVEPNKGCVSGRALQSYDERFTNTCKKIFMSFQCQFPRTLYNLLCTILNLSLFLSNPRCRLYIRYVSVSSRSYTNLVSQSILCLFCPNCRYIHTSLSIFIFFFASNRESTHINFDFSKYILF